MTDQPKVVHRSWKMTDADTTTQSSDTKPQQLDTSGEVQPKVGDVTKGLHLDASVDNSDQPKVVRYERVSYSAQSGGAMRELKN